MESPAKRRRLNDSDVEAGDQGDPENAPRTPTRASYLSPTKSSLARSHPHLITRSGRQTATEPRGKALRDDILKNRPAASDAPNTTSKINQSAGPAVNDASATQTDGNPAEQEPIGGAEEFAGTDGGSLETSSHQPRNQRPVISASRNKRRNNEMAFSPPIMPTLIRRADSGSRARSRSGSDEPELPPTPVELGLSPAPEKPRGLASSSSPRGSKTGSGTPRRRTRSGAPVTSSPLKPKARPPAQDGNEASEGEPVDVDEAPESEFEETEEDPVKSQQQQQQQQAETELPTPSESQVEEAMGSQPGTHADGPAEAATSQQEGHTRTQVDDAPMADDRLPSNLQLEVQDKQATLRHLRAELNRLKEENEKLERVIGNEGDLDLDTDRLAMILHFVSKDYPKQPNNVETHAAPADLTKFLPGKLDFRHQTETSWVEGQIHLFYDLRVRAPHPWPMHVFAFALGVVVDVESGRCVEVELKDARSTRPSLSRGSKTGILKWASGTIWGMGKWFEAAVERAKVFRLLDLQYNMSVHDADVIQREHAQLAKETAIALSKYLEVTQIQFEIHPPAFRRARGHRGTLKAKVLLVWEIDLDWTSSVSSRIDLVMSGISQKAEGALKQVFSSLVPTKGVSEAFTATWKMIHAEDDDLDVKTKTQRENSILIQDGEAEVITKGKRKRA
ncbi:hypothetical protein LTR13_001780 [Exophiala sideris]|uniref:Uncharacterized protein n=1 Tax=Exophiala sideris TaxID=1016849 RepID=A0ABR0JHD5_9EURO|nr:hypothetical protein LTR13_001780 [Exophiala sideris]KAK5064074.1 hypothetical protein LTR69_003843 [Exophiala sideris]KAK5185243.1 hypothetical protein LTR44_002231 [Eurotiomycetes sp. CCFEE 6388]